MGFQSMAFHKCTDLHDVTPTNLQVTFMLQELLLLENAKTLEKILLSFMYGNEDSSSHHRWDYAILPIVFILNLYG